MELNRRRYILFIVSRPWYMTLRAGVSQTASSVYSLMHSSMRSGFSSCKCMSTKSSAYWHFSSWVFGSLRRARSCSTVSRDFSIRVILTSPRFSNRSERCLVRKNQVPADCLGHNEMYAALRFLSFGSRHQQGLTNWSAHLKAAAIPPRPDALIKTDKSFGGG